MSINGLQRAYALSPETEDGDELWCVPEKMTPEQMRAALRVLIAERDDVVAAVQERYNALYAYAREKFPRVIFEPGDVVAVPLDALDDPINAAAPGRPLGL